MTISIISQKAYKSTDKSYFNKAMDPIYARALLERPGKGNSLFPTSYHSITNKYSR
jgi:hypothetical protein